MLTILRTWKTTLVLLAVLAVALALPKCEGKGSHPFTRAASVKAVPGCTRAYGQCEVTEYLLHQRDGTVQVWTCFAQPPEKPGASNVWIAVSDCFRP